MQNVKKFVLAVIVVLFSQLLIVSCSDNKSSSDDGIKSSEKQILSFVLNQFTPSISGTIDESAKTITATIPADSDLKTLVPVVTVSERASVSPQSGTIVDFSNPVVYTVTAEDGTTALYVATVTIVGNSVDSPEELSGSMSDNKVLEDRWDGIDYIISGTFYVEGNALLTVEPGVKIAFASSDSGIDVGENAGLKMVGTAEKPIVLTGPVNNQNKGSWYGIEIRSSRADNQFEYVQFINGGSNDEFSVINIENDAELSIKNCSVDGSLGSGIGTYGSGSKITGFENNTIVNCDESPVYLDELSQAKLFGSENVMNNNGKNYIKVMNANIDDNVEINDPSVPYYIDYTYSYVNKTLTLNAGVTIYFNAETGIDIAESTGKLIVNGTAENPVLLTKLPGETYYWEGIYVRSDIGNEINNATIEYAGNADDEGIFWISSDGAVTLNNVTISNSKNYCVAMSESSSVDAENVVFEECASGNVYNYDTDSVSDNF
ncbi:MAG TPA: DUF5018 domain-containing protein [bacterium]|nr:DUF5018 domain-containing protein [bacterium]HPS28737.1 DUF5018 domain-containing protein [bacterium]